MSIRRLGYQPGDRAVRIDVPLRPRLEPGRMVLPERPSPAPAVYWVTIAACYEPNPIGGPFPGDGAPPRPLRSNLARRMRRSISSNLVVPGSTYVRGEPICWPGPSPCPGWTVSGTWRSSLRPKCLVYSNGCSVRYRHGGNGRPRSTTPYVLADDFVHHHQ